MSYRIGLVGTNGSGKSTVCGLLKSKGFDVVSLSDVVRREASAQGLELNRDNLVATANALKASKGSDALAREVVEFASESGFENVVFDSIRNRDEALYLQSTGVCLIGIDAPIEVRYERIQHRRLDTDRVDFETFKAQDDRENTGKSSGQFINDVLSICEYSIDNSGSEEDLITALDGILGQLK